MAYSILPGKVIELKNADHFLMLNRANAFNKALKDAIENLKKNNFNHSS